MSKPIIIQRITSEAQDALFKTKMKERTELAALTTSAHPNHKTNRAVAYDLCISQGWKYFINNFVWLQDPESDHFDKKEIPFMLYDFQEKAGDEIYKAIVEGYDLPIEKARKMGLTWLVLAVMYYGWQFEQWDIIVGSRKAEEVDRRGDMGTLFEKFRFMMQRTPNWLVPQLKDKKHDSTMKILHPNHGASIVGEGNNPDFGRSDRRKVAFMDEFTSWEYTDRAAWQGLSATTKCRLPVSTPNRRGTNCYFYKVVDDFKKNGKPILTLPWTLHPEFSRDMYYNELNEPRSPWYDEQIRRASDPESVAQEIDINYQASMGDKVFQNFSYEEQVSDTIVYDEDLPLYVTWDFGMNMTSIIWIQAKGGQFIIVDEYQNKSIDIYHYIDIINSKGYKEAIHYGDPYSSRARGFTSGQSPAAILRAHGFIFKPQPTSINSRIAAGRNVLDRFMVSSKCEFTVEMFTSWQMVRPKTGNTSSGTPAKDEHSHIGEAFTYFCYQHKYRKEQSFKKKTKREYQSLSGVTI